MTHHVLARATLYDQVWARPVRAVAQDLGISDVGLGKACRSAGIPTPPRGYWTRAHHGKPMAPRPPLEARPGQRDWVVIAPARQRAHVAHLPCPTSEIADLELALPVAGSIEHADGGAMFAYEPTLASWHRKRGG